MLLSWITNCVAHKYFKPHVLAHYDIIPLNLLGNPSLHMKLFSYHKKISVKNSKQQK